MDQSGNKIGYWSVLAIGIGGMVALYSLIHYTWQHSPSHVWVLVAMLLLAFAVESAYRLWRRGHLRIEYFR